MHYGNKVEAEKRADTAEYYMNHKRITEIFVFSFVLSSQLVFLYLFIQFLSGYSIQFQEPNKTIAAAELATVAYTIVYLIWRELKKDDKVNN